MARHNQQHDDLAAGERAQQNDSRQAELEERLERRGRAGLRPWVSVVAMGACIYFFTVIKDGVAYVFADRTPETLGAEGDYHFEALRSNVYVQLHGVPTTRGVYSQERAQTWVGVGMQDTPIIVWRKAFPSEVWAPGTRPPTPNQTRLAVRGRLLTQDAARDLKGLFGQLGAKDRLQPMNGKLYVLREGERPGDDVTPLLLLGVLLFFFLLNLAFLAMELRHRLRRPVPGDDSLPD